MSHSPLDVYLFGRNWQSMWPDRYIDMVRLWQFIDALPEEQCKLIYLLWNKDGSATALTQKDALGQLGLKRSRLDYAFRRLRHPHRWKEYMRAYPLQSPSYGYA